MNKSLVKYKVTLSIHQLNDTLFAIYGNENRTYIPYTTLVLIQCGSNIHMFN